MRSRRAVLRRPLHGALLILTVLLLIALIGASPLALDGFEGTTSLWERRSFIGQTFGAASAILSVLALIGVVVTMVLQSHETRLAREEARRTAIGDLLKMAMDDPALDECWGPVPAGHDHRARRQQLYVNMILSEWQMSFETRALDERRLRAISREMFEGQVGREFWAAARDVRLSTSGTRRARRFHRILDEEYEKAPRPPAGPRGESALPPRDRRSLAAGGTAFLAALTIAGVVVWRGVSRHRRH